jgi:hypothetical protein
MKQFYAIVCVLFSFSSLAQISSISGPSDFCIGTTGTFTDPTPGGIWSSSNTAVAVIGSSSGILSATAPGATTVRYTIGTGSVTVPVTVVALPTIYSMTGGGNYCLGGAGTAVGLSGSQTGIDYQLWFVGGSMISSMHGTGAALDFGYQTSAGSYTVEAVNSLIATCSLAMAGNATITVNPLPSTYALIGGGTYCAGGAGMHIILSGSQTGVNYALYNTGGATGVTLPGTGTTLDFGLFTAGTYTAVGSIATTGCSNNMGSSATVVASPLPIAFTLTGGGSYCAGGPGVHIILSGCDVGTSYQLFDGTSPVGAPIAGTGLTLDFGSFTIPGPFTAIGTDMITGCANTMLGTATITTFSGTCTGVPAAGYATASASPVCSGTPLTLSLSGTVSCGTSFQWQYSPDGSTWSNLSGATTVAYTYSPSVSGYNRSIVTCMSSGLSANSLPVHVLVSNGIERQSVSNPPSTSCNALNFYVSSCSVSSTYSVTTYFGDGTTDHSSLTTVSPCHANISHTYEHPGNYMVKQVLFNGTVPVDSSSFSYDYVACHYLPVHYMLTLTATVHLTAAIITFSSL